MNIAKTAILIVDHGSRSADSNVLLNRVVERFSVRFADEFAIVESAHMELSEPSIATAYANAVRRGAEHIVVCPFFLGPGKHWQEDIPRLVLAAANPFPQSTYCITAPLGVDDLMLDLIYLRVDESMREKVGSHD